MDGANTLMKKQKLFRQGDVLIERVDKIPANTEKQVGIGGRVILAYGEATGHHHSLDADKADWWKRGEEQFVDVKEATEVIHQEHAPIKLTPGRYRILRQREYSPEAIRNVAD